jgi:hypothetical protein
LGSKHRLPAGLGEGSSRDVTAVLVKPAADQVS